MQDNPRLADLTEEQRLQMLIAGVSDYAIYMLSADGYVSSWNTGAQRFKGYTASEIIGQHFSTFYTDEDRAAGMPARTLRTAIDEGKFEGEGWRVRKDGTRFWASVVVDPIRDPLGRLVGFAKITRDITERHEAQRALRESEERFRLLVQGVTDYAIFMLSPEGVVTNWNSGAQRIKGYREDEIVGQHFSRFYTLDDIANGIPAHTLSTAREQGRSEQEGWRVRQDGTRFWAHVVVDAIRDDAGKLIGFAKVTRDITERKKAAEALEAANAALFQSQKMEALGQLTGGVAHDFNNLLAVMSSSLDVLSSRLHAHADQRLIEGMQRAIERGATLTQQLLSFARQQPLKISHYPVGSLIGGFESVLRRAGSASITMDIRPVLSTRTVAIDAARFEAALLNLVVNARDALPSGGAITIAVDDSDLESNQIGALKEGEYIRVSVTDNGTGMTPDVMARALEPFFTTKEVGKGTGLGLSQVYGFITQSGGEIVLQSESGAGTTVCLYLPATEARDGNSDTRADTPLRTETVLIVEDEPDLMDAASALFQSIGYEVVTAASATDALRLLEMKSDIDILFTDVVMPEGMNGIQLARIVRTRWPHIKPILASGYALRVLEDRHGMLDEFAFINKPYRLSDIAKLIRAQQT
ncbi:two-component system, cell cycle sensor histidine kinase and response regulator CckA [Pararobbsia alpina]|uniref:hybrid sensor histidine kinase/response regulator n=1 Tax=Pararobbsia alpina TaxID=621374 RepID=UPI0039A6247A